MSTLLHTPYDGSATPFTIGLKPLALADWIEVDGALPQYLDEKERLIAERRGAVFRETPDTREAQAEVLDLTARHVVARLPDTYRTDGDWIDILSANRRVRLTGDAPLLAAARLVHEDLVLMIEGPRGWHLGAAALCFPSSWSLSEKFGRDMDAIHASVPGFESGTRNAGLIRRIFDNLKPEQPVWRLNWSLYRDDHLHHPAAKPERTVDDRPFLPEDTFVRVERQTLRRLPKTGAILFTIRIYVDPVAALIRHGQGTALIAGLRAQLEALDDDQIAYKGMTGRRAALVAMLARAEASSADDL